MSKTLSTQQARPATLSSDDANHRQKVIEGIIAFLSLFMPPTLAIRLISILFIVIGMEDDKIAALVGSCLKTVRKLKNRVYGSESVSEILTIKKGSGRKPAVEAPIAVKVVDTVKKGIYFSLRQIADMIKSNFECTLSLSTVSRLLKNFKIKKRKAASFPAKADVVKQREFYENTLYPLMEKARAGLLALYFMDGSHFVMGNDYLGSYYGSTRRYVQTFSGRKRWNVLGSIDFVSKKVVTVCNDTYLRANQVCRMLVKVRKAHKSEPSTEIHLILDNAKYQKCKVVQTVAKKLNISLDYIPPYSPNLNLIERLWKHTKANIRTKHYDTFGEFIAEIMGTLSRTDKEDKEIIDSLIGEKVQLYDNLVKIAEGVYEMPSDDESMAA